MTQIGYIFESEVERGLRLFCPWYFKIPDTKMLGMVNNILRSRGMNTIIFPKVPADYIAHGPDGTTFYIEAKATNRKTVFPLQNIKEHQLVEGFTIDSLGSHVHYIFLMYFKQLKRCFAITPEFILAHARAGHTSITIEDIEKNAIIELPRYTASKHPYNLGAYIDLQGLFNE